MVRDVIQAAMTSWATRDLPARLHATAPPDSGAQRISRKSGHRFSDKDMRQRKNLEQHPDIF